MRSTGQTTRYICDKSKQSTEIEQRDMEETESIAGTL